MSGTPPQEPCAQNLSVRFSRWKLIVLGLGLTVLCSVVDWFSGPEIAFSVIYFVPISLIAYRCGRWLGLAQAIVCGQAWLFVELMTNTSYSSAIIPYWNGIVRFLIFGTVGLLVAEVAERKRGEKALRRAHEQSEERAHKLAVSEASLARERVLLQSILFSMGEGVVVVNAAGKIILSNPAADKILQATGDPKAAEPHPLQELLSESRMQSREISLSRGDAPGELCLLVSGRPLHGADEQSGGGVMVFSDITALRKLEREIAEVSDREQRRLGQDLHDGLCQQLVSMAFAARTLADRLQDDARPEAVEAGRLAELMNDAITQARDVARGLYLVQLEVGGLSSALEELVNRVRAGRQQFKITFEDRTVVAVEDVFVATDLFRIAQEAVGNAVKHSRATEIHLMLEADESLITLRVRDNGIGIPEAARQGSGGMGLHIMQYRARMIGAVCTIEAGVKGGTVLTCSLIRRNTAARSTDGQPD